MSTARQRRLSDKASLSARSAPVGREDSEVAAATGRLIRSLGRRIAAGDLDGAELLLGLEAEVTAAWSAGVAGWRRTGYSDSEIGAALGVTKQAVQQRWPRGA